MPPSSVLETIHAQSDQAANQPKPRKHPNTKRTGELAEAAFVVKAASLGYAVSKPWGDSERYDFILDSGPRTWRVQIKCTESLNANGYQVQSTYTDQKKKGHYTSADIDVLVAYILPLDLWYVVPAHAFPASASLRFYPQGNISGRPPRFEQYREAWHLFQQAQPNENHPRSADHTDDTNRSPLKNCHPDPELAEGEGSAVDGSEEPAAPSPGPSAPEAPETPMERMMTQWAQRVHSLYNRKH
jgi:PD-(D/E)XK nuclease superfamily protein